MRCFGRDGILVGRPSKTPTNPPSRLLGRLFVWLLALGCVSAAQAQTYPDRPIRLTVPFAAGGTVDIVARIIGAKLPDIPASKPGGDNRGGRAGVLGTEMAAQAPGHAQPPPPPPA